MKCFVCGKGPADGVSVFRQNEKGQPGVWACEKHSKEVEIGLQVDVAIIEELTRRAEEGS